MDNIKYSGISNRRTFGRRKPFFVAVLSMTLLFTVSAAFGATVKFETAETVARKHLERKHGVKGSKIRRGLAHRTKTSFTPYYVFEKEGSGFVIVSADNIAVPILGETDSGVFDKDSMPPALVWLLGTYEKQIEEAVKGGGVQDSGTERIWEETVRGTTGLKKATEIYPTQLLTTTWNQSEPYNMLTPLDNGSRSLTGCVATAMAQIMKYYNHPTRGIGQSNAYITDTMKISVPSVNFEIDYDWDNMLDSYTRKFTWCGSSMCYDSNYNEAQANAIATLMYHAGVSVKMNYSSSSSSAYCHNVVTALLKYFGYDKCIRYIYSVNSNISYNDWKELVIGQIENNSPVFYRGQDSDTSTGGHAFIVDGYNHSDDTFHLNWGWGGSYNGFFLLTALNPTTGYSYNTQQGMIINVMPNGNGNTPSQIKVTDFNVSTKSTSIDANIKAKMNYGADFDGKIGLAVVSGEYAGMILDSAYYSITNQYNADNGSYTVNYRPANLSKQFVLGMPIGDLTLQVVTKRGNGAWTPAADDTRTITVPQIYTITYNLNGGANQSISGMPTFYTETQTTTLKQPTREHYKFDGWFDNADFSGDKISSIPSGSTGDKEFYAKWTPSTFTITYNLNGGALNTTNPQSYTIETADFTLNNPTRIGYKFTGWTGSNGTIPQTSVTVAMGSTDDKTYTANWTICIYTVTFNANGGTVTPETGTTGEGWKLTSLPTPAPRTGYTFDDWYTEKTGGVKVTTKYVFDDDAVVYARWIPDIYVITYDLNGGTDHTTPNPTSYTIETANFLLNNPTRTGYIFTGWTEYNDTSLQKFVTVTLGSIGDKSYTANWTLALYTVTFDANGGTVTPKTDTTGEGWKLASLPTPTRGTGYKFNGWYTEDGVKVTTDYVFGDDAVIYALWTPDFYVGPNPVSKSLGAVSFFRHGSRVAYATLFIYDASGNVVKKIRVIDDAVGSQLRRKVSTWNLRDNKGRPVAEGTYLVKGVLKTSGGKREKVSVVVGVK